MKLTHWKCANCKRIKLLGVEIARADAGAICKACQAGIVPTHSSPEAPAQATVTVHRRGYVRRHGADNRDE